MKLTSINQIFLNSSGALSLALIALAGGESTAHAGNKIELLNVSYKTSRES